MKSENNENRKLECTICKKTFQREKHLEEHVRVHTGEKPLSCDICGKKFAQKSTLSEHIKIHSTERPFKCNYKDCIYAAKSKDNLMRHVKRLHRKANASKDIVSIMLMYIFVFNRALGCLEQVS
ncbi:protein krueppel-like [Centruroides sculpturatus]|uniref:protein krueppel-like n=1 Tax=Centruroides sculpturatus TaxID=218467 RepID=UPI000C6DBDF8|nr:protein krueppel-like [Centruroides sculpturatus]